MRKILLALLLVPAAASAGTLTVQGSTSTTASGLQLTPASVAASGIISAGTFSGSGASLTSIPNSATTATSANTASTIMARDVNGGVKLTSATFSGPVYAGLSISTQAAGGVGALVTVSCPAGSYTLTGGCSCASAVAATGDVNMPYPTMTAAGAMPSGWQCQETGATGGQCAAFVICSAIGF